MLISLHAYCQRSKFKLKIARRISRFIGSCFIAANVGYIAPATASANSEDHNQGQVPAWKTAGIVDLGASARNSSKTDVSGCAGTGDETVARSLQGSKLVNCPAPWTEDAANLPPIMVQAIELPRLDVAQPGKLFSIGQSKLEKIPSPRDFTRVTLLAPGAIAGDPGFFELTSFGGATPAENQYYLNGFNISDLRTRLSPSEVPFEFLSEFQISTGGYSAEVGRATGGIVNALSKHGSDVWEGEVFFQYEPAEGQARKPSVVASGIPLYIYSADRAQQAQLDLSLSGPLIQRRLHVFLLASFLDERAKTVEPDDYTVGFQRGDFLDHGRTKIPFGAISVDWLAAAGHTVNVTAFSDAALERYRRYEFDRTAQQAAGFQGEASQRSGGTTAIVRYSGEWTDDLLFTAVVGRGSVDRSVNTESDCPYVQDLRGPVPQVVGCWVADSSVASDERRGLRADLRWNLDLGIAGEHLLRVGIDEERNRSRSDESLSGDAAFIVYQVSAGDPIGNTGVVAPRSGEYVEVLNERNRGDFAERLRGFYFQDQWQVLPDVMLRAGLRLDQYLDRNTLGQTFIDLDSGPMPRLGLSWDVFGDATARLYTHYGRYSIPIGTQAAVRNGGEYAASAFAYDFEGFSGDSQSTPNLGRARGGTVFGDGTVADPRTAVSTTIRPGYQEEAIAGFQVQADDRTVVGLAYTWRTFKRTVEDMALDQGLNAMLDARGGLPVLGDLSGVRAANLQDCDGNGFPDHFACGFDFYFIANPGEDVTIFLPTDPDNGRYDARGEGPLVPLAIPADALGYPHPRREYHAVELSFERSLKNGGFVQGSYTWSQAIGNYEGIVNSSIRQADVAVTQDFDQPGLLEGAYGYLPSDRRHNLKLFGNVPLSLSLDLGFSLFVESGRAYSALGYFRDLDRPEAAYGQFSFYTRHPDFASDVERPVLVRRGTAGRSPWRWNLDLALTWRPSYWQRRLSAGFDVFNVFDNDAATMINEISEEADGSPSLAYRQPRDFQEPRRLRFRVEYLF